MLPFVDSVDSAPSESMLGGFGRMIPEHGPMTSYLPPGYALESYETFIDGGKKTTKFNSQIISIYRPSVGNTKEDSELIRRARVLLDEAGRMHPNPNELIWSSRSIPYSVMGYTNQYRTECLGLHQLNNIVEAVNLIGEDIITKQIDNVITQGTSNANRVPITDALWLIYKDEKITFPEPIGQGARNLNNNSYDPDVGMNAGSRRGLDPGFDDRRRSDLITEKTITISGDTQKESNRLIYQLYLHFLQDPTFDVLKTGYMTWLNGQNENSQRWDEMTEKIKQQIRKKYGATAENLTKEARITKETEADNIAASFITVLAKLDFNMLIGLSVDLMRLAIQFSGIAREHTTEFHDMNPAVATSDISQRDATHTYVVYTVGRHKVFPLASPCKGYVVRTYYWRPSKFSFYKIFFHHETTLTSLRSLIHKRHYGKLHDIDIQYGESIYSDEYEGDDPYYTPVSSFLWRQGFPHYTLDNLDEHPGSMARRTDYLRERQASVALNRSLHANY